MLPESDQQFVGEPVETPESTSTSLLSIDTAEAEPSIPATQSVQQLEEDMSSQLNPDALEFVPLSPQSSAPVSPSPKMDQEQFIMGQAPQIAAIMDGDRILAQSPRKNNGNTAQLENVAIPDEREFDEEISHRPHEWSGDLLGKKIDLNGSVNGGGEHMDTSEEMLPSPQQQEQHPELAVDEEEDEDAGTLNSKEERDLDEGKEEMRDEVIKEIIDNIPAEQGAGQNGHDAVPGEQDPMNMSFHQDVQVAPTGGNPFDLNAVQLLPSDDIEEEDEQSKGDGCPDRVEVVEQGIEQLNLESVSAVQESALPEADLMQGEVKPMELTESESNFYMQQPEEEPERKEFDEKDEEELKEVIEPTPVEQAPVAAPVEEQVEQVLAAVEPM